MKEILIAIIITVSFHAFSDDDTLPPGIVLAKNGVTLSEQEINAVIAQLSEKELTEIKHTPKLLQSIIEHLFDNKVMAAAVKDKIHQDSDYNTLQRLALNKFNNNHYIQQQAKQKIAAVKDFKTLAKQTYNSNIKQYQQPQTYDYYHIFIIKQGDNEKQAKTKAENMVKAIKAGKITIANIAKQYHSVIAGTDKNGIMKNMRVDNLLPALQQEAADLQVGQITGVIETAFGYHILGLKHINKAQTIPYSDKLEKKIIAELKNDIYRRTITEIRSQFSGPKDLKVNEHLLKSINQKVFSKTVAK